jgi:hypothetical protein
MEEARKQRKETKMRRKEKPTPGSPVAKIKRTAAPHSRLLERRRMIKRRFCCPNSQRSKTLPAPARFRLISVLAATTWMMWQMRRKWRSKFFPLHIFIG